MWRTFASLVAVLVLGCSSSSGGGTGGAGGSGGSGYCAGGVTSPNACLGPGNDSCNPCSKITNAQANAAVGTTLTPGTQNANNCDWQETGANGSPILDVGLTVGVDPRVIAGSDSVCNPAPNSGVQQIPVSGVGDVACFFYVGANYGWELDFVKGCAGYTTTLAVGLGSPAIPEAQQQAEEKALALAAVPNL